MDLGVCLGYTNEECPICGRIRVEKWSCGKHVCEKCRWIVEDERYYVEEEECNIQWPDTLRLRRNDNVIMTEEEMDEQLEIYQELNESVCDRYMSVEEKNDMSSREEMIQRIKDCGQYIMDNAESILGDEKYIRELYCTCNFFDRTEPPYVTITKDVLPNSFIERFK